MLTRTPEAHCTNNLSGQRSNGVHNYLIDCEGFGEGGDRSFGRSVCGCLSLDEVGEHTVWTNQG